MLNPTEEKMIKLATDKFGQIDLCGTAQTLEESFTVVDGEAIFWFNERATASTHIILEKDVH